MYINSFNRKCRITEIYQVKRGLLKDQWRFRIKGANGEKIASGESYVHKADCLSVIELIKGSTAAPVVTVEK